MSDSFDAIFARLREILVGFSAELTPLHDTPTTYYLDTKHIMKNKKPLFFASVQIKKKYVSYHLMPVYVSPDLLENISPELKRRMQGKSCFNFKKIDEAIFTELANLTSAGYAHYEEASYI